MFTTPCPRCQGQGVTIKDHCKTCKGHGAVEKARTVVVGFPPGIDSGQAAGPGARLAGDRRARRRAISRGRSTSRKIRASSVTAQTSSRASTSPSRRRPSAADIRVAALGDTVDSPPDTTVTHKIPAGHAVGLGDPDQGQGVPRLDGRGRGTLVAVVQVDVPTKLSERAKALLKELEVELTGAQSDPAAKKAAAGAK